LSENIERDKRLQKLSLPFMVSFDYVDGFCRKVKELDLLKDKIMWSSICGESLKESLLKSNYNDVYYVLGEVIWTINNRRTNIVDTSFAFGDDLYGMIRETAGDYFANNPYELTIGERNIKIKKNDSPC
jgi:hypothetical protein